MTLAKLRRIENKSKTLKPLEAGLFDFQVLKEKGEELRQEYESLVELAANQEVKPQAKTTHTKPEKQLACYLERKVRIEKLKRLS